MGSPLSQSLCLGLTMAMVMSSPTANARSAGSCSGASRSVNVVPGEYILLIAPTRNKEAVKPIDDAMFLAIKDRSRYQIDGPGGMILVKTPPPDRRFESIEFLQDAKVNLQELNVFQDMQPNFRWRATNDLSTPTSAEQRASGGGSTGSWALDSVKAEIAWTRSQGMFEIVVAVVDSGVDFSHQDFADHRGEGSRLWKNMREVPGNGLDDDQNMVDDDYLGASFHEDLAGSNFQSLHGHGTLVAGIIGGRSQYGRPGGVAKQLRLMRVRVLDQDNKGSSWGVARGIRYAASEGAHIINASLQTACDDKAVRLAILGAEMRGAIVVAAAGNDGSMGRDIDQEPSYPASLRNRNLLVVGATGAGDELLITSHYGRQSVDLGAPGIAVPGPWPGNVGHALSGTSFAAPLASGGLVLLAPLTPNWSWRQRSEYLVLSSWPTKPSLAPYFRGGGILDLDRATTAPITVSEPVALDTWRLKQTRRITWDARGKPGACDKLEIRLSRDGGANYEERLAGSIQTDHGGFLVKKLPPAPVNAPAPTGYARLRLTCEDTELHAYSGVFKFPQ